jgi:hypothetical protein
MKNSKVLPMIILFAATTEAASSGQLPAAGEPIKALNQMNQGELRELITRLDLTNAVASIKEIDDQVLSVAKTRQALINLASGLLPEDQVFIGKGEKAAKAPKAEKVAKVPFSGYSAEELAAFDAQVGNVVSFTPKSGEAAIEGVLLRKDPSARSGLMFFEVGVAGKKSWIRTTKEMTVARVATETDLAPYVKAPKAVKAPEAVEVAGATDANDVPAS